MQCNETWLDGVYPAVGEGVRLGVFRQFELLIQSILDQALIKIINFVKSTNLIHLVHNTLYKVIAFRLLIIKDFEYVTLLQYSVIVTYQKLLQFALISTQNVITGVNYI